jgi:hypothetical protein
MSKEYIEEMELSRKYKEYDIKITKMSGYLSDYYIDRAIETDDFSHISSLLIDYFESYDIGYLVSKYKEYELNEKAEDIDFNMDEWYKLKYEMSEDLKKISGQRHVEMSEDEYVQYMIDKRKKEINE